jgi:hypothetical protein
MLEQLILADDKRVQTASSYRKKSLSFQICFM